MCDILIAAAKQLGAGLASSHVSVGPGEKAGEFRQEPSAPEATRLTLRVCFS